MQDLEIKGTGNSRFLKSSVPATTTWEDFLTMLRAGNLPIDLTGLNSAGIITQNPSAYNKANVLPDDVCSALGIDPQTSEPKDAFLAASTAALPKVGDIQTTIRTDLGEKWLLCNGDDVSRSEYPELAELYPINLGDDWIDHTFFTAKSGQYGVTSVAYANGYYMAAMFTTDNDLRLYYTTDIEGSWSSKPLLSKTTSGDFAAGIVYGNGYYAVAESGGIVASVSGSLTGSFYFDNVSDIMTTVNDIAFADGYFVIVGEYNDEPRIAYSQNPTGPWETNDIEVDAAKGSATCVTYHDGTWVVGVEEDPSSVRKIHVAYSTNLSGNFTLNEVIDNRYGDCPINQIIYADGYWVAVGRSSASGQEYTYQAFVAYSTSLDGQWTKKYLWDSMNTSSTSNKAIGLHGVAYQDGYWLVGGTGLSSSSARYIGEIAYSTSLDGEWETKTIWPYNSDPSQIFCVGYLNGIFMVGGYKQYDRTVAYYKQETFKLPTITTDGAYNYIKAEE